MGDEIVWRNLLRHYILIFIEATSCVFSGGDCDRNPLRSFVAMVPDNLPVAPVRDIYERSSNAFLNEAAVRRFVELMAGRTSPIRRYELTNYLRGLHPFAMDAVFREYAAHGIMASPNFLIGESLESMRANAVKMMESAALLPGMENASAMAAEAFFAANESAVDQLQLIAQYQKAGPVSLAFLCLSFPSAYVGALDKLVHPGWYVACFSANPTNASMWGAYGDSHRGACLNSGLLRTVLACPR